MLAWIITQFGFTLLIVSLFTSSLPVGTSLNPTQPKPVAMFGIYVSDMVMFFQNMETRVIRLRVNLFAFNNLWR